MAEDNRKKVSKVIARAWLDKDYHARLMKDPQAVLTEAGIHVKGKVHVHQSTDADHHLVIPKRPDSLDEHVRKQKEKPGACSHDPQLCTFVPELCTIGDTNKVEPQLCSM
jgi:hypothetical protein